MLRPLDVDKLQRCCPLDNGRHTSAAVQPLGRLHTLPIEILQDILSGLNIPTLTSFRMVNRRASQIVDAVHQYHWIFTHHVDVLRAVVVAQARFYSCDDLYQELRKQACNICGTAASLFYLVTCQLLCQDCHLGWRRDNMGPSRLPPPYMPLLRSHIRKHLARKSDAYYNAAFAGIPHILSLPVGWKKDGEVRELSTGARVVLYDEEAAKKTFNMEQCGCHFLYIDRDLCRRYQAVIGYKPHALTEELKNFVRPEGFPRAIYRGR